MAQVRQLILERAKRTLVVWLAVYPSVLLVISLTAEWMKDWPLPLRVLGATMMIVPIVTNISEPVVRTIVGKIAQALPPRHSKARP